MHIKPFLHNTFNTRNPGFGYPIRRYLYYIRKLEQGAEGKYESDFFSNQILRSVHRLTPFKDAYKFLLKSYLLHPKSRKRNSKTIHCCPHCCFFLLYSYSLCIHFYMYFTILDIPRTLLSSGTNRNTDAICFRIY